MELNEIVVLVVSLAALAGLVVYVARASRTAQRRKREQALAHKASKLASEGKFSQATARLVAAGRLKEAMDMLVASGDFRSAARVALKMKEPLRAAELFERAHDFSAAANAFLKIPDLRRAAECFSRAGEHEKASEVFLQVDDYWAAADELVAAGRKDQAAALHRQVGNDIVAARLRGEDLKEKGDYLAAAEAFDEAGEDEAVGDCLALAGKTREAAEAYQRAGKPDKAAPLFEQCGAVAEAAAMYEEAGDHAAAAVLYKRVQNPALEVDALVSAGEILAAGQLAYKLGDKAKAEEVLKLAAPADRGYTRACLLLGRILEEDGRVQEGMKYYAYFVEKADPSSKTRSVWNYLVKLFEKNGLLDLAIKALRKLETADLLDEEQRNVLDEAVTRMRGEGQETSGPVEGAQDDRTQVPTQLSDRYDVLSRLGEGGTAVVYLAMDKVLRREVVLKILSNPSLPGELAEEYFMREAQIVAGMSHPNIVTVYDVGNAGNRMYMVMEYIHGKTLDQALAENKGGFTLERVARMAEELAKALGYAHEKQIIHRDIKPGNIMVLPDNSVKLMDFGMAKALEIHRDRSLYICGTPDYMSPEQEAGNDLTIATDIYSFGLVLLESLLGELPSAMTSSAARIQRLKALDRSDLPPRVKDILRACLSIEVEKRPPSARLVADVLLDVARRRRG